MEARIWNEWNQLWQNPISNVVLGMKNGNIRAWAVTITGPQNTPYYGGLFFVDIEFPNNYPTEPPKFTFRTKIYHVNIGEDGYICLDLLKKAYNPDLSVGMMIAALTYLLSEPNPHDPIRGKLGWQYFEHRQEYEECARKFTLEYAM